MSRKDHLRHDALLQKLREVEMTALSKEGISTPDIILWCLAAVMAVALYLAPEKTPIRIGIGLLCMVLFAIHPTLHLPWFTKAASKARRITNSLTAVFGMIALVGIYGWFVWPPNHRHFLNGKERSAFEHPLKEQKAPREEIQFACPQDDETVCVYAAQFIDLFREAGWKVSSNQVERVVLAKPQAGIVLYKHGTGQLDPNNWRSGLWVQMSASLRSVYRAFNSVGIEPDSAANPSLPENIITIYFGLEKPNEDEETELTRGMKKMDVEIREGRIRNVD
jgi:hypothetical protein